MLINAVVVLLVGGVVFGLGYALGRKRPVIDKGERAELEWLRSDRDAIYSFVASHAATELFAILVMDEMQRTKAIHRGKR